MASELSAAALPAELTIEQAAAARLALQASLERAGGSGPFEVDASGVRNVDTSALAVLLDLNRAALARGRSVEIRHAPAKLTQLAALYGVGELLGLAAPAAASH